MNNIRATSEMGPMGPMYSNMENDTQMGPMYSNRENDTQMGPMYSNMESNLNYSQGTNSSMNEETAQGTQRMGPMDSYIPTENNIGANTNMYGTNEMGNMYSYGPQSSRGPNPTIDPFQGNMNNNKNLYAKGNDICHDCLKALLLGVIFYLLSQKEVHTMMKKCCGKMTVECVAIVFTLIVWLLFNLKWI